MGGYGSTRWGWHGKRTVVEDCLALDIHRVVGHIIPRDVLVGKQWWAGSIIWTNTRTGERAASVGYRLTWAGQTPLLELDYVTTIRGTKYPMNYPVRLVRTYPHFGGVRWWFICPLVVNGVYCNRRVGKLYSPPGARHFGCRHCYDLSYTSAQEAHRFDGLGRALGINFAALDYMYKMERIADKWITGERLTPAEKRKLKAWFDEP